jgi:hypothetical protein
MAACSRRTGRGDSCGAAQAMHVSIPVQKMAASLKLMTPALFNSDIRDIDLKYSG